MKYEENLINTVDEVRGEVLRPPHGATLASVKSRLVRNTEVKLLKGSASVSSLTPKICCYLNLIQLCKSGSGLYNSRENIGF